MATQPTSLSVTSEHRRLLLASVVAALVASPAGLMAGQITPSEENEASFLHKLIAYIEWPPTAFAHAEAPIVLGVLGAGTVFDALSRMVTGRHAHGRRVEVRQVRPQEPLHGMHLLYVGAAAWNERAHWLGAHEPAPVLVTNAPGGIDQGATIGFVNAGQRVRIEASLPAAHKAGVKLSSRLLVVAQRVVEAPR